MIGHDLRYAVEQMLLTLFPDEKPVLVPEPGDRPCFVTELTESGGEAEARARFLARQGEFSASRKAAAQSSAGAKQRSHSAPRISLMRWYKRRNLRNSLGGC